MFINFPEVKVPVQGIDGVKIPHMITIQQSYPADRINDIRTRVCTELNRLPSPESYKGKRICITAGSRGIPDFVVILKAICSTLKDWGATPFIIPAMGSHGKATAQGQRELLSSYGISEANLGVKVVSSMEVVKYGELEGIPLYLDKNAMESDGIVLLNKVKPHTDFRGPHESGLAKMAAIGIAKHKGAAMLHSFGFDRFAELVPRVAEQFIKKCPVVFGMGIVQNAYDDICVLEACTPDKIMNMDRRLLVEAKERLAKFKFDKIDLLIIDEIGKNISGNGHDPNVTGRNITHTFDDILNLKKLFIRGITPEAHHNAAGIAAADVTTRRVLNDVDWESTWANVLTTGIMSAGSIPLYMNSDEEAIRLCLRTCYCLDYARARVVRIRNTMEMKTIQVSSALYEDIKSHSDIAYVRGPEPMKFDDEGNLLTKKVGDL